MKGDKRKLIDLPESVIKELGKLAKLERLAVKNYIEKILIEHSKIKK